MRRLLGLVAAALLAPAAAEAAPFAIGPGELPGVAVDAEGTAYIAFNGVEAGSPPHYCRLRRGASACDVAITLPVAPNTDTLSRPIVNVSGARVTVMVHRYGPQTGLVRYTSTDGGVSFAAPVAAGGHVPTIESGVGPGDTVSVVSFTETAGALFQNVPLAGGAPTPVATLFSASTYPYNGTVGLIGASTPLVIFVSGSQVGAFRRYLGAGDLNNPANWSAPVEIGHTDYPRLAGGPSGLFVLSGDETGGLFVRRWDGAGFGARVTVTANGDDSETGLFQDVGGRLHAVYPRGDAAGYYVEHAVSDDGLNWRIGSIALQNGIDEPFAMRAATAADHVGVAVWGSRYLGIREIRAAAIGPEAPASLAPPAAPAPAPQPATPQPTPTPRPEFHKTVVVRPISGTIRVRLRGSARFVDLTSVDDLPLGATIDARRGVLELRSVPSPAGRVQSVQLYQGMFAVTQSGSVTDFALNERVAACPKRARAAARKPKTRRLWGDGQGAFRTTGRYSAATVRGSKWLVLDSCAGTLTRVTIGTVAVRDKVRRKTVVVRAGKRYLARPPG